MSYMYGSRFGSAKTTYMHYDAVASHSCRPIGQKCLSSIFIARHSCFSRMSWACSFQECDDMQDSEGEAANFKIVPMPSSEPEKTACHWCS